MAANETNTSNKTNAFCLNPTNEIFNFGFDHIKTFNRSLSEPLESLKKKIETTPLKNDPEFIILTDVDGTLTKIEGRHTYQFGRDPRSKNIANAVLTESGLDPKSYEQFTKLIFTEVTDDTLRQGLLRSDLIDKIRGKGSIGVASQSNSDHVLAVLAASGLTAEQIIFNTRHSRSSDFLLVLAKMVLADDVFHDLHEICERANSFLTQASAQRQTAASQVMKNVLHERLDKPCYQAILAKTQAKVLILDDSATNIQELSANLPKNNSNVTIIQIPANDALDREDMEDITQCLTSKNEKQWSDDGEIIQSQNSDFFKPKTPRGLSLASPSSPLREENASIQLRKS